MPYRLSILLMLIFAGNAEAASQITDVSSTDKSAEYIRYIFGGAADVIVGGSTPSSPDSMLGAVSEVLNMITLMFTGIIVGYVYLSGVMNSASDGTPLGKNYDTWWVPLRMTFALALVLPIGAGYSAMQIAVLWLAGNGIGAANATWEKALDHMSIQGTLYPKPIDTDFKGVAVDLLTSRVCYHVLGAYVYRDYDVINVSPIAKDNDSSDFSAPEIAKPTLLNENTYRLNGISFDGGYRWYSSVGLADTGLGLKLNPRLGDGACGSLTYHFFDIDQGSYIHDDVASYQDAIVEVTNNLDTDMDGLAQQIALTLYEWDENDEATNKSRVDQHLSDFDNISRIFTDDMVGNITSTSQSVASKRVSAFANGDPELASMEIGARDAGWITVGGWYWDIQRINHEVSDIIDLRAVTHGPTEKVMTNEDFQKYYEPFAEIKLAMHLGHMNIDQTLANTSYNLIAPTGFPWIDEKIAALDPSNLLHTGIDSMMANPDPITGVSNLGHMLLNWGLTSIAIINTIEAFIAGGAKGDVIDAGASTLPIIGGIYEIGKKIVSMILHLLYILMPVGATMAYYLPAIPLILWILGVTGWFILLIEAVVAAPIWAASHAMPEGRGIVGQRAMAGYMVILSLILRPTLMVIGFLTSMGLMIAVGKVTQFAYVPSMRSMMGDGYIGLISVSFGLVIFIVLMIQVAHRTFSLQHELPDKVLRFISGGGEQLLEGQYEGKNHTAFVAISQGGGKLLGKSGDRLKPKPSGGQNQSGINDQGGGQPDSPTSGSGVKSTETNKTNQAMKNTQLKSDLSPT